MSSPQVGRLFTRPALSLALVLSFGFGACSSGESASGTGGKPGTGGTGTPGSGGASNPAGSGGSNTTGSGGSNTTGSGGSNTTGSGGSSNTGSGGRANTGGNGTATGGSGTATGGSGTATGGAAGSGAGTGGAAGGNGNAPAGYWTRPAQMWGGCVWAGIDAGPGVTSTAKPMPADYVSKAANDPYCTKGTVPAQAMSQSVAMLGFNLNEPITPGLSCAAKTPDPAAAGPAGITITQTGIAVAFSKNVASELRIQVMGPNGYKQGAAGDADRWCYAITEPTGPIFAPFNKFNSKCWDNTGTTFNPAVNKVSAVAFLVPGTTVAREFDYCVGGFVTGNAKEDAPPYTGMSTFTGMIGGPGGVDIDMQRVKIAAGGKSYIIQNNNWGNQAGSDQTITYKNNSFKVVSSTGTTTGQGVPASFPSIYIGDNGNRGVNGAYSTRSDDGLPKTISQIQSVMSTFRFAHAPSGGRNYNATYDIWFSTQPPSMSSEYTDGISGFVMVWLFKPTNNQPIGSIMRTATIAGAQYDVWVGPRGGSGTNSNAPVVSYVAKTAVTALTNVDLKLFMTDAAMHGIQSSWYLTDVFGGFEIWSGSDAAGLEALEFTAVVR
jgi:hypothetical protein